MVSGLGNFFRILAISGNRAQILCILQFLSNSEYHYRYVNIFNLSDLFWIFEIKNCIAWKKRYWIELFKSLKSWKVLARDLGLNLLSVFVRLKVELNVSFFPREVRQKHSKLILFLSPAAHVTISFISRKVRVDCASLFFIGVQTLKIRLGWQGNHFCSEPSTADKALKHR